MRQRDVCAAAGAAWRATSEAQRAPYEALAAQTRAEWRGRQGSATITAAPSLLNDASETDTDQDYSPTADGADFDAVIAGDWGRALTRGGGAGGGGNAPNFRPPASAPVATAASLELSAATTASLRSLLQHSSLQQGSLQQGSLQPASLPAGHGSVSSLSAMLDSTRLLSLYQLEGLLERSTAATPPPPPPPPSPPAWGGLAFAQMLKPPAAPAAQQGEDPLAAALAMFGGDSSDGLPLFASVPLMQTPPPPPMSPLPPAPGALPRPWPAQHLAPYTPACQEGGATSGGALPFVPGWLQSGDDDAAFMLDSPRGRASRLDASWIPALGPTPGDGSLDAATM